MARISFGKIKKGPSQKKNREGPFHWLFIIRLRAGAGPGPGLFQFRFVGNGQFPTTLFTAAGQYFAAIGSLHALTKTVNMLAAASMWLECTFHC